MLELKRIVAFVVTTKPDEAIDFYGNKLGFKLFGDDGFALVFDAGGTIVRVVKMRDGGFSPASYTVLGWEVDDVARAVAELASRGIPCERFPGLPQDESGIWSAPGGARVAWFKDPDGNVLSVSQHP